ncbi:tRNA (adenosine(37)-N6)-threonylcarbamoyltransferase complex dimerization subunit type 1 TsaB [Leekyejoonella antrihumi]|uniref:tRNA (Adenosine(37)-N6)-threonylcarbamoyltransferase complex dimerization subunit type 1 TsaB n=1 Tax=Leekyejoonella antrihumi TaxID=1660198 RepID=A0A563E1A3_9MICO|nr:tRNA (adenosine(37)-N6)-threonylcarbamoyltransferase complex dimerization subunit type 1 TsaB [Leekyejoonella antrihumi]TWP36175.1 tRNA (adenosine(37)-N6)-threonylcarbamoyltransferase complex dimerization subunit type 1 TsaB [Leekyejoonella antrihumi]
MSVLLALDTSTTAVTVAVHDGTRTLAERSTLDARRHTEILAPSIRQVAIDADVTPADLDAVAVGVGPGPFTGLRVGIVTAATLGHTLGIPVTGVCSLDAIAHEVLVAGGPADFLVASDARRKEVYWARYAIVEGRAVRQGEPAVAKPADLPQELRGLPTAGRGPVLYPDLFATPLDVLDVSAGALASFATIEQRAGREPLPVRPLYLRQPDAMPAAARKPVLP